MEEEECGSEGSWVAGNSEQRTVPRDLPEEIR